MEQRTKYKVRTREQYDWITQYLRGNGATWVSGHSLMEKDIWGVHNENTVLTVENYRTTYGNSDYEAPTDTVIEVADLMKQGETEITIEKPVVPQWFDKWFVEDMAQSKRHAMYFVARVGWGHGLEVDGEEKVSDINLEKVKYMTAILHGYTVEEEEPKYYVIDDKNNILLWKQHDGSVAKTRSDVRLSTVSGTCLELTEKEIKDYDVNYWHFARPV